jgi:hypothetical protein
MNKYIFFQSIKFKIIIAVVIVFNLSYIATCLSFFGEGVHCPICSDDWYPLPLEFDGKMSNIKSNDEFLLWEIKQSNIDAPQKLYAQQTKPCQFILTNMTVAVNRYLLH